MLASDECYEAMVARDPRFDGRFFVGVLTTGIYCRPVCPARTPLRRNVRFFASSAAAAAAGLRACRRCRPDSLPGSRDWDHRSDLIGRALRLIAAGAADEAGVGVVAMELGVSERHLRRELESQLGASPSQLARARRAQTARLLLEQTPLPVTDIAFAAGFRSVRQFNDVMRAEFGRSPSELRRSPAASDGRASDDPAELVLRLRLREPYDRAAVLSWLRRHAALGVDEVDAVGVRTTTIDGTSVAVRFSTGAATMRLRAPEQASLTWLPRRVAAVRQWLDLDANAAAIADALGRIPQLRDLVRNRPGLRVLGAVDPFRALCCTILAQQVSVRAAGTQAARLAAAFHPAAAGFGARFPQPAELAGADPDVLAGQLGVPRARGRTLVTAAAAVADGELDLSPAADRESAAQRLLAMAGIGPWTVAEVRMRALADPDVWPGGDLVIRREAAAGGLAAGLDPVAAAPWRSYAAHHLWVAVATARADRQAATRPDHREPVERAG